MFRTLRQSEFARPLVTALGIVIIMTLCLAALLSRGWPSLGKTGVVEVMITPEELTRDRGPYLKLKTSVTQDAIRHEEQVGASSWSSSRGHFGSPWLDSSLVRIPNGDDWKLAIVPDTIYRVPVGKQLVLVTHLNGSPAATLVPLDDDEKWTSISNELKQFWKELTSPEDYRNSLHRHFPTLKVVDVK